MARKDLESSFNNHKTNEIFSDDALVESQISSFEQAQASSKVFSQQHLNHTKNEFNDIAKIDWEIVDDILMEEFDEELPIIYFDKTRPTISMFFQNYPTIEEITANELVRAYVQYILRKNIRLSNFTIGEESLEKVADVQPMFHIVKSVLEDMGISIILSLDRKRAAVNNISYVGRPESSLILKEETIIVLNRIGCKLNIPKGKKIKFTHPTIIKWFNKMVLESLTFQKESLEDAFNRILDNTYHRMAKEFIYLID